MAQFKNLNDLEVLLQKYIIKAMELTRDEILDIVTDKVSEYYAEPVFSGGQSSTPEFYERTYKLRDSLSSSPVVSNGSYYSFIVGWDDEYLEYKYPGSNLSFKKKGVNGATGKEVLEWFNASLHGGNVKGKHDYWDEVFEEIISRGNIHGIFKRNLIKVGIPIK